MNLCLAMLLASSVSASTLAERGAAAEAVVAVARAAVEQRLKAYPKAELTVTGHPVRLAALMSGARLRTQSTVGYWPRSRFTVDVQIIEPGRATRTVPVGFALAIPVQAWVYRGNLPRHAHVDQPQIMKDFVDIAGVEGVLMTDPEELVGQRLRHTIRAGQVVRMDDFEVIPDVDNRQRITVKAVFGAITVESTGVAMRAGNIGDVVTVRVSGANEAVRALVIDQGVAQVVP